MSAQMTAILREVRSHEHVFDWDRKGLGKAVIKAVAQDIYDAMALEMSPENRAWPALSAAYQLWKAKYYPGLPMGVLDRIMRQLVQLIGQTWISAQEMRQVYGLDDIAKDHAEWFQEGNSRQPPRPFFMFGPSGEAAIAAILDAHFAREIG